VESGPFPKVGRVAAEIDGNVPDVAGEDAHQFSLGLAKLIVEAAENPFDREGLVVLNKVRGQTGSGKG